MIIKGFIRTPIITPNIVSLFYIFACIHYNAIHNMKTSDYHDAYTIISRPYIQQICYVYIYSSSLVIKLKSMLHIVNYVNLNEYFSIYNIRI